MIDTVLIDGDIIAYRCAATAENQPEEIALYRVEDLMNRIIHETSARNQKTFLSGANNFRYEIYPEYKAHRKDKPKPMHLSRCLQYLVEHWNATITDGIEADDALGIAQTDLDTCISSIDKDLLQIPGHHYNFVRQERIFISPFDGLRKFYGQVIAGDGADNIPSYDGKIRQQVPKFIQRLIDPLMDMTEEEEMYNHCLDVYGNFSELEFDDAKYVKEVMHRNAKCLYVMRKENDFWLAPHERESSISPA